MCTKQCLRQEASPKSLDNLSWYSSTKFSQDWSHGLTPIWWRLPQLLWRWRKSFHFIPTEHLLFHDYLWFEKRQKFWGVEHIIKWEGIKVAILLFWRRGKQFSCRRERKNLWRLRQVKTKHGILFSKNIEEVFLYSDLNAYKWWIILMIAIKFRNN